LDARKELFLREGPSVFGSLFEPLVCAHARQQIAWHWKDLKNATRVLVDIDEIPEVAFEKLRDVWNDEILGFLRRRRLRLWQ
jgi:hypothetical protein